MNEPTTLSNGQAGELTPEQMREIFDSGRTLPRRAEWAAPADAAAPKSSKSARGSQVRSDAKARRAGQAAMNAVETARVPRARAGRFALFNAFVDYDLAGATGAEAAVWLVLFRDSRNGIAKTGQGDIAARAGCTRRAVIKAVKKLESRGLLTVAYRGGLKRGISSYKIHASGVLLV